MTKKNTPRSSESLSDMVNREGNPLDVEKGQEPLAPEVKKIHDSLKRQLDKIIHPEKPAPKPPSSDH